MTEDIESVKLSLQNINDIIDIKDNSVVASVLMAPVKAIPILGDLIDSSLENHLSDFQRKKEQELVDVILKNSTAVTTEMVNDVEFIINYARVVEAIKRLATNDKVKFFGNLIRNGYLSVERIESSEFDEYVDILNTMSYREIKYLIDYKEYCEAKENQKKDKSKVSKRKTPNYNYWRSFLETYTIAHNIEKNELYYAFSRIKRTGFIDEDFKTDDGDVDEDNFSFSSLSVDSTGFYITKRFLNFFSMVLKIED